MPRKNPFPIRERQISERLREFRSLIKLSRLAFAAQAGLDASLLRSYESARSQLNYVAAYKVIVAYGLNPEWLATGNGRLWLPIPIPSPKELNVGARKPFSEIYSKHLSKLITETTKEWESRPPPAPIALRINAADPRDRLVAEAKMVNWIKRLILCLPDARLETVLNFLYLEGTKLVRACPADSNEVIEKRFKAMDHARAQMESLKNCLADERAGKDTLDINPSADTVAGMSLEVPTWKQLKKSIAQLTVGRGAKAALAAELGVSRQVLGNWLSSDDQGAPNAELTLRLLKWVRDPKRATK